MRRTPELAARAALVMAAALAAAWLANGLRAERLEAEAARLARTGAPESVPLVRSRLEAAARHTRSTRPQLRLAQYETLLGRQQRAQVLLEGIVRGEPRNADAWRLLAQVAPPARAAQARAALTDLSPPVR